MKQNNTNDMKIIQPDKDGNLNLSIDFSKVEPEAMQILRSLQNKDGNYTTIIIVQLTGKFISNENIKQDLIDEYMESEEYEMIQHVKDGKVYKINDNVYFIVN